MTWPSVDAPATAPADHGEVRTQAYYAGGGDYFRSGYYSLGMFAGAATTSGQVGQGTLLVRPFIVPIRRSFDRIGINVLTASASGAARLGIYGPGDGRPGTLVVDAGTVSTATTGAKEITISQSLDPGIYWLAVNASQDFNMSFFPTATIAPFAHLDPTATSNFSGRMGFYMNGGTASLPTFVAVGTSNAHGAQLRAA